MIWIEEPTQKHTPLSIMMIIAKIKSLLVRLKEKSGSDYDDEFTAKSKIIIHYII